MSDCCVEQVVRAAYCGATFVENEGHDCETPFINGDSYLPGVFVPGAPVGIDCAITGIIPTSQADCNNLGVSSASGTFVPATLSSIISTGNCILEARSDSSCGCSNSIPVTQSVDLCDLAGAAYNKLSPNSLNLFGAPCA